MGIQDTLIWHHSKDGKFSVKSAYQIIQRKRKEILGKEECSSSSQSSQQMWKKTWKLPIKPKVKNFLWRCLQNCLGTLNNLEKRGMTVDGICGWCGECKEDLEHIMFTCTRARRAWKVAGLDWDRLKEEKVDFREWWKEICRIKGASNGRDRISLSSYIMWWLWKTRNGWLFEKERISEKQMVDKAIMEWQEYEDICKNQTSKSQKLQGVGDAGSALSANGGSGMRIVIKGRAWGNNEVMHQWDASRDTGTQDHIIGPVERQLLNLRKWLLGGKEEGWHKVEIFIVDPKMRKQVMQMTGLELSMAILVEDIHVLLTSFANWGFVHSW
ncbi:Unknown protein [Striga hermonthica]|uniref:Reverse transcriptase zinc-binding domain-containing protein n=1 Tax=Striga hermonthica TaxID=68872 RepID=A0A9N7NN98_STRHE|nr:Unknown protein [Striga hermonthica]